MAPARRMVQHWIRLHGLDADTLISTCVRMNFGSAQLSVCPSIRVEESLGGTEAIDER
jgi:hypothetical protein